MRGVVFVKVRGVSIIEFMIASVLGLFILSIVITVYLAMKRNYQFNIGMAKLHENASIAGGILSHDLRQAGYFGCGSLPNLKLLVHSKLQWPMSSATVLEGNPIPLLINLGIHYDSHSDAIILQYIVDPVTLLTLQPANSRKIVMPRRYSIARQALLIIADCQHGEVLRVLAVKRQRNKQTILLSHKLKFAYAKGATIGRLAQVLYFVAGSIAGENNNKNAFDLYRRDLSEPANLPSAMVSGVDRMQLRYGIRINKKVQLGLTADQVSQRHAWVNVALVTVYLSVNSVFNVFEKPRPRSVWFAKNNIKDRLLHQPWVFTIAIRSRQG